MFRESYEIYATSKILIIILRKKDHSIKLGLDEIIVLNDYITKKENIDVIYSLYSMISLKGNNIYPICKNRKNNIWYKYSGQIIEKINNFNDIVEKENPYILFYEKIK